MAQIDIPDEARSVAGKRGAAKSAETRKRKRNLRMIANALLDGQVLETDDVYQELQERGFEDSYADAMMLSIMSKAMHGDVEAARFIRDTAGQKPRDQVEIGNIDGVPLLRHELANLSDETLRQMMEDAENGV